MAGVHAGTYNGSVKKGSDRVAVESSEVQPVTDKQRRSERVQIVLAVVTLLLVALEESLHIYLHHVV